MIKRANAVAPDQVFQKAPAHSTPCVRHQPLQIGKHARSSLKHQNSCLIWLTGLSASGKTTIANRLEERLHSRCHHTYLLDGDNLRLGLNRDLDFSERDRAENIRRAAEVARLMVDAGLIVICAFISPFRAERQAARSMFDEGEFIEVYVDVPLAVAEQRDPKGLYKRARRGELQGFTGIDAPYEPPLSPELHIETVSDSIEQAVEKIMTKLSESGLIAP